MEDEFEVRGKWYDHRPCQNEELNPYFEHVLGTRTLNPYIVLIWVTTNIITIIIRAKT